MEFRKPIIKAGLTALITLSALTLYAANELRSAADDDIQYINYLQSQLDQRSFFKRQWSKGKATPYLERAEVLVSEQKIDEAINTLEIYLESDQSHYLTQWKLLKLKQHQATPKTSLNAANRFLKLLPKFGPARLIRAQALQQMQRYEEAAEEFQAAIDDPILNDKDRFDARQALYFISKKNGDKEAAFAQLQRLLDDYPKSLPLTREYARELEARNRLEEAADIWKNIPKLTRDETEISHSQQARAALLQRLGKTDEALLTLEKLKAEDILAHGSWDQRLQFARLYSRKEKYAQALKYLLDQDGMLFPATTVEKNRQNVSFNSYLRTVADLALKLKRHPLASDAISKLNQTARSPEDKFRWLTMLGTLAQSDSQFEKALEYFERALRLKDDMSLRLQAAEVAWHLQEYNKVTALLEPAGKQLQKVKQSKRVIVQQRLCEAMEKSGQIKKALECTDKLLKQHPENQRLMLRAANLAGKSGNEKARLRYLKTAQQFAPPSRSGIRSQDHSAHQRKQRRTLEWFRQAYQKEKSFEGGYAYASALLRVGQRDAAIIILSRLVNMRAAAAEKFKALHALGYAMAANGDFLGAATAWERADKLHPTPVLKLRRTWALYGADKIDQASRLLGAVAFESLPESEKTTWFELQGMIRHKQARYTEAISARHETVKRAPSAKHWSQLAESYAAQGDYFKADNAYEKAIAVSRGDKSDYVLQRAYLKIAEKKYKAAQILLDQALVADPENPVIEEELGYAYARLGMNKQAAEQFKQAINHYQTAAVSGRPGASKIMQKRNRLSKNVADLEQGLTLSFWHSGNLKEVALANSSAALIAPYRLSNGGVEISYQPKSFGYNEGKKLQFYARNVWNSSKQSVTPSSDSSSVGVGVRYKPFAEQNAWVSAEHISGTGDNSEDNSMLRGTYQRTKGYDWPLDDDSKKEGSRFYSDIYLDIAKLLQKDAPTLAFAEVRAGRAWQLTDEWLAAPHAYVRGQAQQGDENAHVVDAGLGISARLRGAYDFYEGYKADSEFYLRFGQDVDTDGTHTEKETRASIGLKLSY